jgi:LCCL domain
MTSVAQTASRAGWLRRLAAGSLLAALVLPLPLAAGEGDNPLGEGPAEKTGGGGPEPGAVEVRFIDDSALKLTLRDERIPLSTPYGKLLVPVADIRRIEFGWRVADDVARRIETAIANLGSPQFRQREAATAELLKLREKAYPALLQAAKQKDAEVVRRAKELLQRVRDTVPEENLVFRPHDVVHTEDSKITGRIEGSALKAHTFQFGDVQLKLADLRSLRSLAVPEEPAVNAARDPGTLVNFQNQVGKRFHFRVTGAQSGNVWGTDVYTGDSLLAAAAVHAGVLRPGQTGVVQVEIVAPPPQFQGSSRNGITSFPYGLYPGAYKVSR